MGVSSIQLQSLYHSGSSFQEVEAHLTNLAVGISFSAERNPTCAIWITLRQVGPECSLNVTHESFETDDSCSVAKNSPQVRFNSKLPAHEFTSRIASIINPYRHIWSHFQRAWNSICIWKTLSEGRTFPLHRRDTYDPRSSWRHPVY